MRYQQEASDTSSHDAAYCCNLAGMATASLQDLKVPAGGAFLGGGGGIGIPTLPGPDPFAFMRAHAPHVSGQSFRVAAPNWSFFFQ